MGQVLIQVLLVLMMIQITMTPFVQSILLGQISIQVVLVMMSIQVVQPVLVTQVADVCDANDVAENRHGIQPLPSLDI